MRLRTLIGLLAALILLLGCNSKPPLAGVKRDKVVRTIVSLSPSTTEVVGQVGIASILKGRTASCNYPLQLEKIPVVVKGTVPDYEKLRSIKPDLIVYDANLYSESEVAKIAELGIDTLPMKADSIDQLADYYAAVAQKVGGEQNASEYIDKMFAKREASMGNMAGASVPAMVLLGGGGELMAAGSKSFLADVVAASGGKLSGPDSNKFEAVNVETILQANPAVILTPFKDIDQVLKDPRLASVQAVKNKRVYGVDPDILLRAGSRVEKLIEGMNSIFVRVAGN